MSNRIKPARLAAEFGVIVIGVLTALGADAWWDGQQEAKAATQLLEAVEAELRVNLGRLEQATASHGRVAQAGFEILNLTGPDANLDAQAAVLDVIPRYYGDPRTTLSSEALSAAIATGALRMVQDESTRWLLERIPAGYDALTNWEERIALLMAERVYPQIWLYVPQMDIEIKHAFGASGPLWEDFVANTPARSRFEPDAKGLLADLIFENVVVERTTLLQVAQRVSGRLHSDVESLLAELEAQRERGG